MKKAEDPERGQTGDIEYVHQPSGEAVDEITVRVDPDTGEIVAAIPEGNSEFVKQWISDKQEWLDSLE